MLMLVWLFGQIAGVTDCQTILNGAQTMACISRPQQLPALIWLAYQILNAKTAATASVFMGNYGGSPPPFTPIVNNATIAGAGQTTAIALDTSTGQLWSYFNGVWN